MPFRAVPLFKFRAAGNSETLLASVLSVFVAGMQLMLGACSPEAVADPFNDSGELIALSGGDAGPTAACHTCHGLDGGGDGALVPRIAAMNMGYLVRQLDFFADGQRSHAQMSWLSARLESRERAAVSAYYAQMPMPDLQPLDVRIRRVLGGGGACPSKEVVTIYHDGLLERGLQSCATCHGDDGQGVGQGNSSLIGQSGAYVAEQLERWREGKRYGDPLGVMHEAASNLRKDEIKPLSDYIAYGLVQPDRPESLAGCP